MAIGLAALTVSGAFLVAVPTAEAPLTGLIVTPSRYTGTYTYVPEETISFTLTGDAAGEVYDAVVAKVSTGQILQAYNDVTIPPGLSLTLQYPIPATLPDEATNDYRIEVGVSTYIENGRIGLLRSRRFNVQAYELTVETDRVAYLGGDDVIITWTARNLKDGSLAPNGYGQLWVYDATGAALGPYPYVFPNGESSGSYRFTLDNFADPANDGRVIVWFNDSASNPIRFQQAFATFEINSLGVLVDVTPSQYAPGGIVTANVHTVVTNNQPNPSPNDPDEPNINVDISVWEIPPPPAAPIERPQYGARGLITDAHGELTYVFNLDPGIADGTDFEVRANASHRNQIWRWEGRDTFTVSAAVGMTIVLQFNQNEYQAGDTAQVTAIVSGAGSATLTYIFEVRDSTNTGCPTAAPGTLLATSTQGTNTFSYAIPNNFDGDVCFVVAAIDGEGNRVTSSGEFTVVFGWLLVNANQREYKAGDTVVISWVLRSNRITDPRYFYEVWDANGNLATSGSTDTGTSFPFLVPPVPSRSYTFEVSATQQGRTVTGSITLSKIAGFVLDATFDRAPPAYAPGDTMRIRYAISPRGDDALPSTFVLSYGLLLGPYGGSVQVTSTPERAGELTYVVPQGIAQGDLVFWIGESNTGAQAQLVVTIRGTNPLAYVTVGDIPVFDLILLFFIVVIFLLLWRRGMLGRMGAPKPPEAPAAPPKSEPVHAPPTSPMTVTCRSCGAPIEITTSKRPIEVMCPKCGNTEMVS